MNQTFEIKPVNYRGAPAVSVANLTTGFSAIYDAADLPFLEAIPQPITRAIAYRVRRLLEGTKS